MHSESLPKFIPFLATNNYKLHLHKAFYLNEQYYMRPTLKEILLKSIQVISNFVYTS